MLDVWCCLLLNSTPTLSSCKKKKKTANSPGVHCRHTGSLNNVQGLGAGRMLRMVKCVSGRLISWSTSTLTCPLKESSALWNQNKSWSYFFLVNTVPPLYRQASWCSTTVLLHTQLSWSKPCALFHISEQKVNQSRIIKWLIIRLGGDFWQCYL